MRRPLVRGLEGRAKGLQYAAVFAVHSCRQMTLLVGCASIGSDLGCVNKNAAMIRYS